VEKELDKDLDLIAFLNFVPGFTSKNMGHVIISFSFEAALVTFAPPMTM
jgi:hypothetical protein